MASMLFGFCDHRASLQQAELRLLESEGSYGDAGDVAFTVVDVDLGDAFAHGFIHTVKVTRKARGTAGEDGADQYPLVLWPGYGQGPASFWRNLPDLARRHPSGTVYAADWYGCGLSSRPQWDRGTSVEAAEAWFVDTFKAWKTALAFEKMHLVGHSMGGMIAVAYAERHPEDLATLTLASPAGVPPPPERPLRDSINELTFPRRFLFGTALSLWERGNTPHSAVRMSGSFIGRSITSGYVNRRFEDDVPNKPEFAEYMYQLYQGAASGEKALQALLMPGAYAKSPLVHRIPALNPDLPLCFIYGSRDWMDIGGAYMVRQVIKDPDVTNDFRMAQAKHESKAAVSPGGETQKEEEGTGSLVGSASEPDAVACEDLDVQLVRSKTSTGEQRTLHIFKLEGAGHQLFIDKPIGFNDFVIRVTSAKRTHARE